MKESVSWSLLQNLNFQGLESLTYEVDNLKSDLNLYKPSRSLNWDVVRREESEYTILQRKTQENS